MGLNTDTTNREKSFVPFWPYTYKFQRVYKKYCKIWSSSVLRWIKRMRTQTKRMMMMSWRCWIHRSEEEEVTGDLTFEVQHPHLVSLHWLARINCCSQKGLVAIDNYICLSLSSPLKPSCTFEWHANLQPWAVPLSSFGDLPHCHILVRIMVDGDVTGLWIHGRPSQQGHTEESSASQPTTTTTEF